MANKIDFNFDKPRDPPTPDFANAINGEQLPGESQRLNVEALKKASGPQPNNRIPGEK
jgi:hypothetical protein